MRCFFHLISRAGSIPDESGIEVANIEEARAEALKAIAEFRREEPSAARDWEGWQLRAADEDGTTLFTLSLTENIGDEPTAGPHA